MDLYVTFVNKDSNWKVNLRITGKRCTMHLNLFTVLADITLMVIFVKYVIKKKTNRKALSLQMQ